MRFIQTFIFCFLIFGSLGAQSTSAGSQIVADIEGLSAGTMKLVGVYGDRNYLADSCLVDANGHFELKREEALPAGFYTFLLPGMKNFSILMGEDQEFQIRAKVNDIMGTIEVEGALEPELFYRNMRFQSAQEPELRQVSAVMRNSPADSPQFEQAKARQTELLDERKAHLEEIFQKYPDAFFTTFKRSGQNPDFVNYYKPNGDMDTLRQVVDYRNRFWDGFDFEDERLLYTPVPGNKLKRYIKDLTPQNRDSLLNVADALIQKVLPYKPYFQFFSNWIALQYENGKTTVMDGEAVYVHIIQKYFTPELAFWDTEENLEKLRKHAWEMEASLLWKKGPDVKAPDQYGKMQSIYEKDAQLIVVFMFSPHCEHCQEQAPEIEKLYQKWKDKGVDFYGISVNTTDEEWQAFLKRFRFSFTNVFDPTNKAIYAKYYVDNTPELYLLDQDRTIVGKNLHANQLEVMFERYLK
jgi:peroxiredoxin